MPAILCLGVDPAPSRRGSSVAEFVCIGEQIVPPQKIEVLNHNELRARLMEDREEHMLLAWDAPLTGPSQPADAGHISRPFDFTIRPIERALSRIESQPPKGISVQGYAGCQHWTITRNLLGLPRVGPFDSQSLPFTLIDTLPPTPWPRRMVVEVHPALAIWLWVTWNEKEPHRTQLDLRYKRLKKSDLGAANTAGVRKSLIASLCQRWRRMGLKTVADAAEQSSALIESDDALDAFVAGLLAALLVQGHPDVRIYGDRSLGAFLLPAHPCMECCLTNIDKYLQ